MPTVPTYNRQVKDAGVPAVSQSASASEETFGGPSARRITEAAQNLTNTVFKIADQEKRKADQLSVLDADKQLSALETTLQYDPKDGAMNKLGKDSFSLPDTVKSAWEKGVGDIEKNSIKNDSQRMAYREMVVQRWKSIDGNIQRHVSGEIKKYDSEVTDSYLANERNAATANYLDPVRIETSVSRQRAAIADHATRNGLPEEWVKLKVEEATSRTHSLVIDRMLANDQDIQAQSYFTNHRDQITGSDVTAVEKALEAGTLRGESQRQTDQITSKATSMVDAIEQSKKINDPKLRDAVTDRIKDHYSLMNAAEDQRRQQVYQAAADVLEQTKDRDRIPPTLWAELSLSERNSIDARARQLREGIPPVTSWPTYYELKTMASSPAMREKFLRENLMTYRHEMADPEFKELINLQTSLRNGDEKDLDGYRTKAMIVNDTLNAAGIDPTPKPGKREAESVALFRRAVDQQIETLQGQTGKKASNEDVQGIVDNLIVKGTVAGTGFLGFFRTKRRAFEAQEGENIIIEKNDIPRAERMKIEDALKRRGLPITDGAVIDLYNRKLMRMVPRATQ